LSDVGHSPPSGSWPVAGPSSCAADQGRRVRTGESYPDKVRIGRSANIGSAEGAMRTPVGVR